MVTKRLSKLNGIGFLCQTSKLETKNVEEALDDESWVTTLDEELNQFIRNGMWYLVYKPKDVNAIRSKYIFKNKCNENCVQE